jgi:hypothetical protein
LSPSLTTFRRIAIAAVFALIPNTFYAMVYRFGWEDLIYVFGYTGVGLLWNPFFLNFLFAIPFMTYARKTTRGSVRKQPVYSSLLGIMALVCFWPSVSLVLIIVSAMFWSRP